MSKLLFIGAFASVITINAFATSSTVTSRDYVDAQDALKQNKIPATDAVFTRGSVVETTGEDGVVTQRGIYDGDGLVEPTDYKLIMTAWWTNEAIRNALNWVQPQCVEYNSAGDCLLLRIKDITYTYTNGLDFVKYVD
ncbi:MAG: hypothetical protein IJQ90_00355 [Alphaproteobacteria bacterium]|nr:hypothetical protein [Alphaproteobacteria bacterium]